MNARELVADLRSRGVRLEVRGDRIRYVAPPATMTPVYRRALAELKPEVMDLLRGEALGVDWTRVNLWQLDKVLEVAVPWSDVRLILAPGCRVARALRAQDPRPGRVWCTCELLDLLLSGVSPEDARTVAEARLAFDATLDGVRKEGEA